MIVGCHDPDVAMAPKLREIQLEQIETEAQDPAAQGNEAAGATDSDPSKSVAATQSTVELSKPISLFDGKTLEYWEEIEFGGEGDVEIKDGVMSFEMGDPFTGIASTLEDLPKTNFEVSLEARKRLRPIRQVSKCSVNRQPGTSNHKRNPRLRFFGHRGKPQNWFSVNPPASKRSR